MRRNVMTSLLGCTALAATLVTVATGSAAGAPQGGCVPTWRQVDVSYSDYRAPVDLDIAQSEAPIPGAVSALSGSDVRLAGNYGGWDPYLQHWTGRTVDSAPRQLPIPPQFNDFYTHNRAQSFSSPDEGWVLVSTELGDHGGQSRTVAYHWHDERWTMVPTAVSPNPLTHGLSVNDVVSVSPGDAWLVGARHFADRSPIGQPDGVHIERWDGTRWSIVDNPMATVTDAQLISVTALSARDVWATGMRPDGSGVLVPLMMHWNGTEWRVVEVPTGSTPAALRGISGTGPNDVWAVGGQTLPGTNLAIPLVMHWDGTEWRAVEVPDVGNARYHGVYAASPTSVWAVGEFPAAADAYFLHWDGRTWQKVRPPGAVSGMGLRDFYLDIHGTGPNDVWAVGVHNNPSTPARYKPLVAHLTCGRIR
jgi:hypothetical protein